MGLIMLNRSNLYLIPAALLVTILAPSLWFHDTLLLSSVALAADPKKDAAATPEAEASSAVEGATKKSFTCEADLTFSWKRNPPKPRNDGGRRAPPQDPPADPVDSFSHRASANGDSEEGAKSALQGIKEGERAKALVNCRKQHEDAAKCVADKYVEVTPSYERMDFQARRKLLEAIELSCETAAGQCLDSKLGAPECHEVILPVPITPPSTDKDANSKATEKSSDKKKK